LHCDNISSQISKKVEGERIGIEKGYFFNAYPFTLRGEDNTSRAVILSVMTIGSGGEGESPVPPPPVFEYWTISLYNSSFSTKYQRFWFPVTFFLSYSEACPQPKDICNDKVGFRCVYCRNFTPRDLLNDTIDSKCHNYYPSTLQQPKTLRNKSQSKLMPMNEKELLL